MLLKHWRTNDVNKAKINFVRKFLLSPVIFHAFQKSRSNEGKSNNKRREKQVAISSGVLRDVCINEVNNFRDFINFFIFLKHKDVHKLYECTY